MFALPGGSLKPGLCEVELNGLGKTLNSSRLCDYVEIRCQSGRSPVRDRVFHGEERIVAHRGKKCFSYFGK